MQARYAELSGATDAQDHPAAVASHCFELARQIGGGPVCEALAAMGRDYSARARETAQTAGFRIELERNRPDDTRFWPLRVLSELCAPLPARHAAPAVRPTAPAKVQHAAPAPARPTTPAVARSAPAERPRRGSRLYRLHALGRIEP
jgi:hypothetical protein